MQVFNTGRASMNKKIIEYCCEKCAKLGFNFEKLKITPWKKDCKYCNNTFKHKEINKYGGIRDSKTKEL